MDTTWRYDAKDGTLTGFTDPNGNNTVYGYNTSNDILRSVTNGSQKVSYTYSSDYKHLNGVTHGNTAYSFTYDEYGNSYATKVGNRTLATNTYYPNNGSLKLINYGNGSYTSYSYDYFGNIFSVTKDNVIVAKNYSNGRGDIIRSIDKINDLEYRVEYDTTGRLTSKNVYATNPNTNFDTWKRSVEYEYDIMNNIAKRSLAYSGAESNVTNYQYDRNNRPYKTILNSGKTFRYYYDGLSRVTKAKLNTTTPIETVYSYINIGSNTTTVLDTEVSNAFAYSYSYDNNGNITKIRNGTKQSDGSYIYGASSGHKYEYDRYNQLTEDTDYDNGTVTSYTYDTNGNITQKAVTKGSSTTTTAYTYADTNGWGDLLTAYNGEAITYDEVGNPLTYRDGMTMTWRNGRELATLTKGVKTLNFTYDPNGLRTKKTVATTSGSTTTTTNVEYIYEGGLLMHMTYGNYVLDFSYDANGTPVGFRAKTTGLDKYYYYGLNSRGDVVALYNADGTLHARYEYDTYGKLLGITDVDGYTLSSTYDIAVLNPLRYRSYVYDTETGLYYLQSRYYDPTTCRFINADGYISTGQGINGYNMFAYCNNNPVMYSDPTGTRIFECCPYGDCAECKKKASSNSNKVGAVAKIDIWGEPESHVEDYSDGYLKERWYGEDGRAQKDRHHTDHGNSKNHPDPHDHQWNWDDSEHPYLEKPTPASDALAINWGVVGGVGIMFVGITATIYVVGNDFTGVGFVDDAAIVPAISLIIQGFQKVTA